MHFSLSQIIEVADDGPIYRETTDLSQLVVEPWNAYSSLTFLIPAFIFLWQLRGSYREHAFLIWFCTPMLILGGLGSTFFHAFRSSGWLLAMDVAPILLLVLGISVRMWLKVLSRKWLIIPILVVFFGLTWLSGRFLEGQDEISAGYFVRGLMLFLPCFLFLLKTGFRQSQLFFAAVLCFILALAFRFADEKVYLDFMPWGTHWLWHVSTAVGGYFLGEYLVRTLGQKTSGLQDFGTSGR
jgi:hemolysin III